MSEPLLYNAPPPASSPHSRSSMYSELAKKLEIVKGAKPVSAADYKLFQQALKETPAGRWRPRHIKANGSDYAKMNI